MVLCNRLQRYLTGVTYHLLSDYKWHPSNFTNKRHFLARLDNSKYADVKAKWPQELLQLAPHTIGIFTCFITGITHENENYLCFCPVLNLEPFLFKEKTLLDALVGNSDDEYVEFLEVEAPSGLVDMVSFHFE